MWNSLTTSSDVEEASKGLSITKVMSLLGACWVVRTGGGQVRTVGATLQVQGHLTWAGRAKQQAEGGGGRWILSALSRLNYSTRPSSGNTALPCRVSGALAKERGLTDDGRPRAITFRLGPTHEYSTMQMYY